MGATFGPALIGELLRHVMAKNSALLSAGITDTSVSVAMTRVGELYGMVQKQALVVSMKEIFGWLLIVAQVSLMVILVSYSPVRPWAIFPKWKTIRRAIRHLVRRQEQSAALAESTE